MKALGQDDTLCLQAAKGWLELGNSAEAAVELERIAHAHRSHPEVLEVRWMVLDAAGKRWPSLRLAEKLIQLCPERTTGWIFLSLALHRLNQTEEAVENLIEVVYDFPDTPVIAYELARYSCCLGQWREARQWLEEACLLGNPRTIHSMAREDPDLRRLMERWCGREDSRDEN